VHDAGDDSGGLTDLHGKISAVWAHWSARQRDYVVLSCWESDYLRAGFGDCARAKRVSVALLSQRNLKCTGVTLSLVAKKL
jgi:hypothetical protein